MADNLVMVPVNGVVMYADRCGDVYKCVKDTLVKSQSKLQKGYKYLLVGGIHTSEHRIVASAFLGLDITNSLVHIDHINGIRDDNRVDNLRLVTPYQNCLNRTKTKGYYFDKQRNKWRAQIRVDGILKHLGYFTEEADAHTAYLNAKKVWHVL